MKKSIKGFSLKGIIIIIIVTAIVTSLTTGVILYSNTRLLLGGTNIQNDQALIEFLKIYHGLDEDFYADIDKTGMIDAAIEAMLNYLGEDYSTYLNESETKDLAEQLSGKYVGIGVSISNGNQVAKVHLDTPASRAGLQDGDIIIAINGTNTESLSQLEVSNLIDKTNENILEIERNGELFVFKIKAETINNPIPADILEENGKKIGYMSVDSFTNTIGEEFKKTLDDLENRGLESLIIDLRFNAGGYLKGATEIASYFLKKGSVIYSLEGKDETDTYYDETDEHRTYPVVILINESSASASEVLAASLKDSYGSILVGQPSFGKGRVQQTKTLEDGSMVKYTTAKWLRPNGECIDEIGILPDYTIQIEEDENGQVYDTQFQKAKELLLN